MSDQEARAPGKLMSDIYIEMYIESWNMYNIIYIYIFSVNMNMIIYLTWVLILHDKSTITPRGLSDI